MSIILNKNKLYEKNLEFVFYLGRGAKKQIIKLYNIFNIFLKLYNQEEGQNILIIGGSGWIRRIYTSHDPNPNPTQPTIKKIKNS